MKSRTIRLLENSIERTARMLSKEYGIRVVWKGTQAMTDGRTITLPVLPDNAPDALLEAVQGYLDHETAHIIFTDFSALTRQNPKLTPEQHLCVNTVEDVRIEARMGNIFPGSPYNFRKCHEWIVGKLAGHWSEINQFKKACAAYFYLEKFGENEDFYRNVVDPTTKEIVDKCVAAVGSYDQINSTEDSIAAGLRMYEILKEYAEEEKNERENQNKAAEKKAKAGEGQSSQKIGKDGTRIITSVGELGEELSKEADSAMMAPRGAGGKGTTHGYEHGKEERGYLVYSTEGDTVSVIPELDRSFNSQRLQAVRNQAVDMTNVIKMRLINSLRAASRRRWLSGKEEGKLDSRRLYKVLTGDSNNVYKQLTEKVNFNTVVGFAIDHSTSMRGRKLGLAGESAIVIGDALNTLRIPFMVYGYSTERPLDASPGKSSLYARWGRLWIRYYRDFDEPWERGATRLAGCSNNFKENTLDAESIKHGIQRLLLRPERRKILFVLNDGMPNPGYGHIGKCQQHLRDVINSAKSVGVEIVAFGIQDDDVKQYYPSYVVIKNLNDLVAEPLVTLDKLLRSKIKYK